MRRERQTTAHFEGVTLTRRRNNVVVGDATDVGEGVDITNAFRIEQWVPNAGDSRDSNEGNDEATL
jgi:hypothetical protein